MHSIIIYIYFFSNCSLITYSCIKKLCNLRLFPKLSYMLLNTLKLNINLINEYSLILFNLFIIP